MAAVTIERRSAADIEADLRAGILRRDPEQDVTTDFVPHVVTGPLADVASDVQGDAVKLAQIVTLQDPSVFVGELAADLDRRVRDEGIVDEPPERATCVLTWYRFADPVADLVVRRGEAVGTSPDGSSNEQVRYVAAETTTLPLASASAYYSLARRRYEATTLAISTVPGKAGVVGARRLSRPVRALTGWDGVENLEASSDAADAETAERKIERWNLAITGEQVSTPDGLIKSLYGRFAGRVLDATAVGPASGYVTRTSTLGTPVDCHIVGSTPATTTESYVHLGRGQIIPVARAPLLAVASVRSLSSGTTYTEGDDYVVVTGRGTDDVGGVYFTAAGAAPAVGETITITYSYDALIRELQETYASDQLRADGRDLRFFRATAVPVVFDYTVVVRSLFAPDRARALVRTRILEAYGRGRLGRTIELSDVNSLARRVPALDNFTPNRVSRASTPTGVSDISLSPLEYATLADPDLILR